MSAATQSVAAAILVFLAVAYLAHRWWRNRKRGASGCGEAGTCGCSDKLKQGTTRPD